MFRNHRQRNDRGKRMKNNAVIKGKNMLSSSIASLPRNSIRANAATPPTANIQIQPHSIKNSVCIKLRYSRNRGGICGKTYGNGFDIFSCCSRQFEKSSVSLFIIPSSEFFVCLPISHTTPTHTVSHRLPPVQGLWTLSIAHLPSENNHRFLRANASPAGVDI